MIDSHIGMFTAAPQTFDDYGLRTGGAGLMVGRNRQKMPVTLRPFRPVPTRLLMVGSVGFAQLLAFRAMAIGARLLIQTAHEREWDAFLRRCGAGRDMAVFLPPGTSPPPAGNPAAPHLIIVNVGTVLGSPPTCGPWQTALVVRDELATWDDALLQQSDIILMQRLTEPEAATAATSLGIQQAQSWLPQLPEEIVGLVSRSGLQWVNVSTTPTEQSLFGSVARRFAA